MPIFQIGNTALGYMDYDDDLKKYVNVSVYLTNQDQRNATKT